MRSAATLAASAGLSALAAMPEAAWPQSIDKTVPTFSSLWDGQPNDPGQLSLAGLASVSAGQWQFQSNLQYTPTGSFWSNALFSVIFPTVDAGDNIADAETSATFGWQQRWFGSDSSRTTFSTSVAVQIPVHAPSQSVDFIATAGLTRVVGKGVAYLNAYVETEAGSANPAPTQWGVATGYLLPVSPKVAVVGDVLYARGGNLQFETSLRIDANDALSVGPGLFVATDIDARSHRISAGAGVLVTYSF